jgi:hypothetical protein
MTSVSFHPKFKLILRVLKKYGVVLADNAGDWVLFGAPDDRWNIERLRELQRLRPDDFEAVDVSVLQVSSDSGKARQR